MISWVGNRTFSKIRFDLPTVLRFFLRQSTSTDPIEIVIPKTLSKNRSKLFHGLIISHLFASPNSKTNETRTMKITVTVAAFTTMMGFASAFAPNARSNAATSLRMADAAPDMPKEYPKVNGWVADPSKFCAGLPGSTAPLGQFDPLGLTKDMSIEEIKRYRESEVTHGRVAMLATLGYLVGENFHPFFGGVISGPANTHLAQVQEVAPAFFVLLTLAIGTSELFRATTGWQAAEVSVYVFWGGSMPYHRTYF
jgi:hypothetical protein